MKDELREAARVVAEQKQRDDDVGSLIPCEWSHLGIFRNGFDAGYEAGKPKWIPVSERLPDTARFVWVTITDHGSLPLVFEAHRDSEGLTLTGWCVKFYDAKYRPLTDGQKVIAWQEIPRTPEPYTEGE